jgi:hypothetical protein
VPKYTKLLNADEDPIDMHAVVPSEGGGSGSYKVRKAKQVGTGRAAKPPNAQSRQVRVKVKTHDKARGAYRSSVSATLGYVAKEGRVFDRERDLDERDKDGLADEWGKDRLIHHWMINPQDGDRLSLDQVKEVTRETMKNVRRQLPADDRADFRWMAGAEQKDGSWHVHVAVRGVVNDRDLTFHPVFERHHIRSFAEEATTDQLGWRGARGLEDERNRLARDQGRDQTDERDDRERDRERVRSRDVVDDRSGRDDGRDENRRRRERETVMDGRER